MAIFKDELFEAQWLRAAGHASYDAAEIGECLEIARQIGGADPERWFAAWSGFASRLFKAAELSEQAGHSASARGAYLRASNYWRAAGPFCSRRRLRRGRSTRTAATARPSRGPQN